MAQNDIYRAYNFLLDFTDLTVAGFTEVSGLSASIQTISYREGGGAPTVQKLPGRVEYGDVTLKWGLTESRELWDWLNDVIAGTLVRREVSIILLNPDGQQEETRWSLHNAWPSAWRGARLDAMGQEAAIETLTLVHEGLERA